MESSRLVLMNQDQPARHPVLLWLHAGGLALILVAHTSCSGQPQPQANQRPQSKPAMTPPNSLIEQPKDLQVRLAIGSQGDLLLPDQAALFEISLRNAAAQ